MWKWLIGSGILHYLSIINKIIHVDNLVFDLAEKVKITNDNEDLCFLTKKDSTDIVLDVSRGQILKLYLNVNDDWLYLDKIVFNYDTLKIDKDAIDKILIARKDLIKEIIDYDIK